MLTYSQQQLCLQMKTNHKQDTDMLSTFISPSYTLSPRYSHPIALSVAMTVCLGQRFTRITGGEHLDEVCVSA